MSEALIQAAGQGWTGDAERQLDGSILLRNPRPFQTGLPKGFADLFGWRRLIITPAMVGQAVAQFIALQVKGDRGRPTPEQLAFIAAVERDGGRAGVVRSVVEAAQVALG